MVGSGFSKSFCPEMPTLKDLNGRIPDCIGRECSTLRDYCYALRELCRGEKEYLEIESVATSILSAQIFPGERERLLHATLRFELLQFISCAMRRSTALSENSSKILSDFLKSIRNDRDAAHRDSLILSFNYDTLIEDQIYNDPLLCYDTSVDYGVNIEPADRSAERDKLRYAVDLIKLHGSLNWYTIKGAGAELDLKNVCCVEPKDRSYPLYQNENPIFIPMAHAKESFLRGSLFNVLWAKADYYLSRADEIFVIGYGFPKTDMNSFSFLLKHRDRIRKVVVFESKKDPVLSRLTNLFGADIVESSDAKSYLCNFKNYT